MNVKLSLIAVFSLASLAACSSILSGTQQTISFTSSPEGAVCNLTREGRPIGSVTTPGGVVVERTKHDIHVSCSKEGYEKSDIIVTSDVEGATFGNILLGGGIGWAVDSASGADNKYQENVSVTLAKK